METLPGSVLGLLLDLDNGTLVVYKDRRRLGVRKDGLSGVFYWCVDMITSMKRGVEPRKMRWKNGRNEISTTRKQKILRRQSIKGARRTPPRHH